MRKDELRKQTRQELLEAAKKLEIRGRSTMSKEELVDAIAGSRRPAEPKEEPKPAPRGRKPAEPKRARATRGEEPAAKDEPAPSEEPSPKEEPPARRSDSRRDERTHRPAAAEPRAPRHRDDDEEEDEHNWNSTSLGRDPNYGRFLAPGSIPPRPGAPASRRPGNQNGQPRSLGDSLSDRSERGRMRAVERSHVTRDDLRRSGDARRGSGYTQRYGRPQDARDDRSTGRGRGEQGRSGRDPRDGRETRDVRDSRDPRDSRDLRDSRGDGAWSRGDQRPGHDRRPVDRHPRDARPDPRRSRPTGGVRSGMSGGMVDEGEVGIESRAEMILEAPRSLSPASGGATDTFRGAGTSPPTVRPMAAPLTPPSPLPRHYGIDRCRLMVRDPHCIHAYWEIRNETMDRARGDLAEEWDATTRILRVHGIPISGDANDPPADSFDIPLKEEETSYYVPIPRSNRGYRIDVGLLTRAGMFYPLASSNTVIAPRNGVSQDQSESWAAPPAAASAPAETTVAAPPASAPAPPPVTEEAPPASSSIVESTGVLRDDFSGAGRMAEGVEVLLESGRGLIPSGPGIPPGAEAPTSPAGERGAKRREGKFWFVVNTELVIYGATEPDAKVTLQGKPVRLRSDGTFSLRFELPDGEQVLRAEAVSADGEFARVITPVVVRTTTSEERNPDSGGEA